MISPACLDVLYSDFVSEWIDIRKTAKLGELFKGRVFWFASPFPKRSAVVTEWGEVYAAHQCPVLNSAWDAVVARAEMPAARFFPFPQHLNHGVFDRDTNTAWSRRTFTPAERGAITSSRKPQENSGSRTQRNCSTTLLQQSIKLRWPVRAVALRRAERQMRQEAALARRNATRIARTEAIRKRRAESIAPTSNGLVNPLK